MHPAPSPTNRLHRSDHGPAGPSGAGRGADPVAVRARRAADDTTSAATLPAEELDDFVDRFARNVAALPGGAVAGAKCAIAPDDTADGLVREHEARGGSIGRPAAQRLIAEGLARGPQTPDGERDLEGLLLVAAS